MVSVDFRGTDVSSTIDSSLTMVMGQDMLKVLMGPEALRWGIKTSSALTPPMRLFSMPKGRGAFFWGSAGLAPCIEEGAHTLYGSRPRTAPKAVT